MLRLLVLLVALSSIGVAGADEQLHVRRIQLDDFKDRVLGGWAGKMIGVAYGYPTEFRSNGKIFEGQIAWVPSQVEGALEQDDLYVGITLAETVDQHGLLATSQQFGESLKHSKYRLWHANAAARRLLNIGVAPPQSGHPKYNIHANDIDFQIEADFIGMMCPGLPQQSNHFCDRVGRVMNYGDGLYGGMFVSGMYSCAYFEKDIRKVVEGGLACLPRESTYAQLLRDVLDQHQNDPSDWRACWHAIEVKWDKNDSCFQGARHSFNIDAKLNGGYVAMGLLYGNGEFADTLEIATRAGQDSDCNPSTAAGILGVMYGYKWIPQKWKAGISKIRDKNFRYTSYSLDDICDSTVSRAMEVVRQTGGVASDTFIEVPYQAAQAASLEQWSMGIPTKRMGCDDQAFTWNSKWKRVPGGYSELMLAETEGAEMLLEFDGTAVAIFGVHTPAGGLAKVYLDGAEVHGINAYAPQGTHDDCLWHIYGLDSGHHKLRIVTEGTTDSRATGTRISIRGAVVYDAHKDHAE